MKVLFVSRYAEPNILNSNANVPHQVRSLREDHGLDVCVLTWPWNDGWRGPVPQGATATELPPLAVTREGLPFFVINPEPEWNERTMVPASWEKAVAFGMTCLAHLRPDIVHLQHWWGLWWILESAQRLGIPTAYSSHDWGLACLRTILVTGSGSMCDGVVGVDKCSQCIWTGRGLVGRANELLVRHRAGQRLTELLFRSPLAATLRDQGSIRLPLRERVTLHLERVGRILSRLDALFVPSGFAREFFLGLGVPEARIVVEPWYHDAKATQPTRQPSQPFTITFIGRIAPEKGVDLIFAACETLKLDKPIWLRIAGSFDSAYGLRLKQRYPTHVGRHRVDWLGWCEVEPLFLSTDVTIFPSRWIDNTPLGLVESFCYKVPAIVSRVPTMLELVEEGKNGYLADFDSADSLRSAIVRAVMDVDKIRSGQMRFPVFKTCREYAAVLRDTYGKIGPRCHP